MADWSGLRRKWADARDKAGVKKGSVGGVSLGDAIDKVATAHSKGYASLSTALDSLKDDLTKYKAETIKSNPHICKWNQLQQRG